MSAAILALVLSQNAAAAIAVKVLAVGGAFILGFVVVGILVFALDRSLAGGRTNRPFKRVLRGLGGTAAAVAVAMILFGSGGDGLIGGGPGDATGTSSSDHSYTSTPVVTTTTQQAPKSLTTTIPASDSVVQVTVLGGTDVKAGRFYQIDTDTTPLTFEDVKTRLTARKEKETARLTVGIRFPEQNAPARDHPAVIQLQTWAEQAGMNVLRPAKS